MSHFKLYLHFVINYNFFNLLCAAFSQVILQFLLIMIESIHDFPIARFNLNC